jgi:AmmeMemoRadiSam system protein B
MMSDATPDAAPAAGDLPDHVLRPQVRPVQPIPVKKDGKPFVALRDPSMLQKQTMVIPMPALQVIQQFQGKATLDELAERFGGQREPLVELATNLDRLGLLWGPTFERLEKERWEELKAEGTFPPRASLSLGADADAARAKMDEWLDQTEDPELEFTPRGLVAPHLDYARGWPNYAGAWRGMRDLERPDRVVILGTNHFGLGDGVVMTELDFETPLGRVGRDRVVTDQLFERFGRPLTIDQLDHLPEHSIDLQLPWIQHCLGDVPVVAALIPDPLRPMIEDGETERVGFEPFIDALSEILDAAGGRTFFVASSDLSHVGPQFGEPRAVDEQRSTDVERHDREMMGRFLEGDAEQFLAAMEWNKNPTRWCSIGNMTALLRLARPTTIELIDYRQARDERGMAMVSSAAMALG